MDWPQKNAKDHKENNCKLLSMCYLRSFMEINDLHEFVSLALSSLWRRRVPIFKEQVRERHTNIYYHV
jgi:hypothetical protein